MPETKVLINLSNRHVHLSKEDVEILFGAGYSLKKTKDLLQPGQFACEECVTIHGPKSSIANIRVLGPERKETQCEILASDVFKLGFPSVPVRESGQLEDTPSFIIEGPKGRVTKQKGIIVAKRHIHFDPESAAKFNVADKEIVNLIVNSERGAILMNVVCRVNPAFALECHLDFDEGNALGIASGAFGEVQKL